MAGMEQEKSTKKEHWLMPLSDRGGKSLPALVAERLRAGRRCNRWAFCPFAIGGTGRYDENDRLACGRKRLPLQVRGVEVPTINPCPDSNGSGHRAFA